MGMLLHSNEHLQISTVAERLLMFATCGRIPWKASSPKLTGKWTWRPERLVLVVEGGGGISEGIVVGIAVVAGLKVSGPQWSLLNMEAGLSLSADTMMGFPGTRSFCVSLRDKTW
jgi:hypothetical protein